MPLSQKGDTCHNDFHSELSDQNCILEINKSAYVHEHACEGMGPYGCIIINTHSCAKICHRKNPGHIWPSALNSMKL